MVDRKAITQTITQAMSQTMAQAVEQAVEQAVQQAVQQTKKQAIPQTMDSESEITLGLLSAVEENDSLTQRSVAQELGITANAVYVATSRVMRRLREELSDLIE